MKRLLQIIFIILVTATTTLSQPRHSMNREQAMERIHAAKIAYITDRLHLTEEQSGKFIPLFDQYELEIRQTRQAFFKKYKGADQGDIDNAAARQYIDDNLDYQQQVIDIKRKYNDRFLAIISPQQLAALNKAEREFRQILMKRLNQQRGGGGGGHFNHNYGNGY